MEELKQVQHLFTINLWKYLKKSILDFLQLEDEFSDIEIENEDSGKPVVRYDGRVKEKLEERGVNNIQVSISHSRNYVTTLVVIE